MKDKNWVFVFFIMICFILTNRVFVQAETASSQTIVGVSYQAHVENIGWQPVVKSGDMAGTTGKNLRVEAIRINIDNPLPNMKIRYRTHVENKGWQPYVYDGQVSGTTGESLRVEAIQIELEGAPDGYHIEYQVHVENIGWMDWVKDGQVAGTTGQGLKVEAIRIKITNTNPNFTLSYQGHVENIGWQPVVKSNDIAGTTGKDLRMEAVKISIDNPVANMKIKYRTHVENKGWLPYVYGGQVSGTTGEGLRVEAIQIELEGAPSGYHVQYQAHVENLGWMNWVEDGQIAGTTGQALKLEALRIRIVNYELAKKTIVLDAGHGGTDPGAVANGYKEKDLNIQIVQKLGEKLTNLGFNVLYTRQPNNDVFVELADRVKFANDNNADLFISIHHDSSDSTTASGTSTHYSTFRPGIDNSGAYFDYGGKRYQVLYEKDGYLYYNDTDAGGNIVTKSISINTVTAYDATPSDTAVKSASLAQTLVDQLSSLGVSNRGSRDHNLYVTRWTNMPSVLVEVGFVSNLSEITKISAPSYQDQIAQKITDSVNAFFNN